MGFWDKFKKRETQVKTQNQNVTTFDKESADGRNMIFLCGISSPQKIQHSNGRITDLIMAKIIKYTRGGRIYLDNANDISFEIDHGQALDQNMLQYIMWAYDMQTLGQMPKENYLGRLTVQNGQYQLVDKSVAVQNIVNNMIATRDQRIQQEKNQRMQQNAYEQEKNNSKEQDKFRKRIRMENIKYEEERRQEIAQRLSNPTLKNIGRIQVGNQIYNDYDGINVFNGDILRLRSVNGVGKDGSGTYLYSAYVNSTFNKYDEEGLNVNRPSGYPVCFTLEKRLEDVVAGGNPVEIKAVLAMLSSPENFKDMNSLVYAGKTDKYGRVINEEKMGEETKRIFESSAIGKTIQAMKKQFERDQRPRQEERGE